MSLCKVVPLCHPIPPHSCIANKVVVILAIQHVMRALQEEQRAAKGLSKLPAVSISDITVLLCELLNTPLVLHQICVAEKK